MTSRQYSSIMKWCRLVKVYYHKQHHFKSKSKSFKWSNLKSKSLKKRTIYCSMRRIRVMISTQRTSWHTQAKMWTMITVRRKNSPQEGPLWTLWLRQILHLSELLETPKANRLKNQRIYPRNLRKWKQSRPYKLIQIQVIELICPKALSCLPPLRP